MVFGASGPTVAIGDTVRVNYTGSFTNGTIFGSSAGSGPLNFTVGAGQVISGFNNAVIGMKVGETKNITLPANEAYGEINPDLIVSVPRSSFGNTSNSISVGMQVTESSNGQEIPGVVTAFNSTNVTVDFNPALAGKTLVFKITILGIEKKS